ncbi:MAG: DNA-directed RNA polymerase subunit K [Thermoplasmata archaeon]
MKHTRFEIARIIGARALQISLGAPPIQRTDETDPFIVADLEYEEDVLPMCVVRS